MKTRFYPWILVGLLWVVALLNYLDRQVIFTLFPLLQSELSLTAAQLGLLGTAFLWVYGLLSPVSGFLADRFSRSRVIVLSVVVWSVVTYLTGHARNFSELLGARALMGISEAAYLPAALALIADYHGTRTRSLATGIHQSGLYIGMVLGGLGGGWLGEHYGWRSAFTVLGGVGVGYAALLTVTMKGTPPVRTATGEKVPSFWPSVRELLVLPGFRTLLAVNILGSLAYWMVYTWLPLFLYERYHMSLTGAGFSATFYIQAAAVAGILVGGVVADRWAGASSRGRLLTQFIGFAVAGPALFLVGSTGSNAVLVAALIVFGVGKGFYDCNQMPVLCQIARPNLRATGYGIFNFAACIAGGMMAFAAGATKDSLGLAFALQLSACVLVVAAVLLLRLRLPSGDIAPQAAPFVA